MFGKTVVKIHALLLSARGGPSQGWLTMGSNAEAIWSRCASNKATSSVQNVENKETFEQVELQTAQKERGTYDEIKEAARRSGGDPAKEWLTGPIASDPSALHKVTQASKNELYDSTKRGLEDGSVRHDVLSNHRYSSSSGGNFSEKPDEGPSTVAGKIKGQMDQAADVLEGRFEAMKQKIGATVASVTGNGGAEEPVNARAVWEASRSDEQKMAANASRKSQLTDEAHGTANSSEATPRMDKQTLPDPLDTPH